MELKDVILSTIAEIGEMQEPGSDVAGSEKRGETEAESPRTDRADDALHVAESSDETAAGGPERSDELLFLERLRERLLVLFEGFQSPNNRELEAKIDLTLNFLEYLLATLDERIKTLKKP
ncbi:CiaD-like domain-containing protein [Hydrogenimonas sp.]